MSDYKIYPQPPKPDTKDRDYTESLVSRGSVWWKKLLDVQAPYRWHIRSLRTGHLLDVGCGIGRNLEHLQGEGVGVDHNHSSVKLCRKKGLTAFDVEEFKSSHYAIAESFDTILLAHVAEHMSAEDFETLIRSYHQYLKPGGRFIVITPQEAGFNSDPTHIEFVDHQSAERALSAQGYQPLRSYSFPFPRWVGKYFKYNEFVTITKKI